jgi:hypothetical protein
MANAFIIEGNDGKLDRFFEELRAGRVPSMNKQPGFGDLVDNAGVVIEKQHTPESSISSKAGCLEIPLSRDIANSINLDLVREGYKSENIFDLVLNIDGAVYLIKKISDLENLLLTAGGDGVYIPRNNSEEKEGE